MTDAQWLRIRSFMYTCSGLCVGHDRFVGMAQAGAPWRRWVAAEYGKRHSIYRR